MSEVRDINENRPHENYRALCLANVNKVGGFEPCFARWIATVPENTKLGSLECPKCGNQDSFVSPILIEEKQ